MLYRTTATPVFGLRREIDRLFEDTFGRDGQGDRWPSADIAENEEELTFMFEIAGVKPEHVEITCDKGVLTVRGERQHERKEEDEKTRYHLVERSYGTFVRSFQLPQSVDEDNISAEFNHGVLTVHVPKAALPQPKKIEIRAGEERQVRSGAQTGQARLDSEKNKRVAGGMADQGSREQAREPMAAGNRGTQRQEEARR